MDKKLYNVISKLIKDIMKKESPQWSKKIGVILDKNSSFMESLEVDSLLALQIVSKLEKKFGVKFKEEDFVYFDKMENIVNLIERKLKVKIDKNPPKSGLKAKRYKKSPKKTGRQETSSANFVGRFRTSL